MALHKGIITSVVNVTVNPDLSQTREIVCEHFQLLEHEAYVDVFKCYNEVRDHKRLLTFTALFQMTTWRSDANATN